MTVRILRTEDYDEDIERLDRECFRPSEAYRVVIGAGAQRWVALEGEDAIGYAVAYEGGNGYSYLDRYGVAPAHGGRGLGKRLLRAWLGAARRSHCRYAWTYTVPANASSINALIAAGFRAWRPEWGLREYCIWRRRVA